MADRRKPSSMNGAGPGRGKSRPGTVDTQKRTAGESHTPSRLYSADVGADVVLSQPPKVNPLGDFILTMLTRNLHIEADTTAIWLVVSII